MPSDVMENSITFFFVCLNPSLMDIGFQFTFQFPITANEMGTLMNFLLFCNVSKFHAAASSRSRMSKMVSIPKLITVMKLNHSVCPVSLPPENVPPSSFSVLYKNELLQIDQVEHDNDLSQNHFFHPVY